MGDNDVAEPSAAKGRDGSVWPRLPSGRLDCYVSLWQLELWLRDLVYLELKSRYGIDWSRHLVGVRAGPKGANSRLTHMPTRERGPLSYLTFSDLLKTISKHRRLFAPYLPIRSVWDARIEEVAQIRNRVAHFRQGHDHDLSRVKQLLADIDKGIWHFCTSYNDPQPIYPPTGDKVAREFLDLDPFPWRRTGEDNTIARVGHAPRDMVMSVAVEKLRRPWLRSKPPMQIAGKYGYLYDVTLCARNGRAFNYTNVLSNNKSLHELCCHIFLDRYARTMRLTLPAILGASTLTKTIQQFIEMARHALRPSSSLHLSGGIDSIVQAWPEYVLGPDHPFSFLSPDMSCAMFDT